jgi:hypothetical protein
LKLPRFQSKTAAMTVDPCSYLRRAAVALFLLYWPAHGALAQTPPYSSFSQAQSSTQMPPSSARPPVPAFSLSAPSGGNAAPGPPMPLRQPPNPPQPPLPQLRPGEVALLLSAHFNREKQITAGLHWRIYADRPEPNGMHRLIKEDRSASPALALPAGGYIVHVTLGLASAGRTVHLRDHAVQEAFEIPAGGLRLEGRVGDVKIAPGHISFDIHKGSQFEAGEKKPAVAGVMTGDVVLLPEGTYFIVSKYGDGNAVVRSDIRVQAGRLTDVTVTHRAAAIMLKLVSRRGGEALANTEWAVVAMSGDVIAETKGAFPRVILAEGEYRVIARNENRTYPQDIKVITGVDGEIEVLAR